MAASASSAGGPGSSWNWDLYVTVPRTSFAVEERTDGQTVKSKGKEFAIYHIHVETAEWADVPEQHRINLDVPKRFNDFRNFHSDWSKLYAALGQQVPLPSSVTVFKNDQHVVSRRRFQLQAYLQKLCQVKAMQPLLAQFLGIKFKALNWRNVAKSPEAKRFAQAVDDDPEGNTTTGGSDPHVTLEKLLMTVDERQPKPVMGPKGLAKYEVSVRDSWHSDSRPMKGNTVDASEAAYQAKMDFINKHRGILDSLLPGRTYTLGISSSSMAADENQARGKIKLSCWLVPKEGGPQDRFDHDLHITVHECIDLPKSGSAMGFADPYVKLYVLPDPGKNTKQKTVVRPDTLNPKFGQTFRYEVNRSRLKARRLECSVWDRDLMSTQHFMGQVILNLGDPGNVGLGAAAAVTKWYDLKGAQEGSHALGQIRRSQAGSRDGGGRLDAAAIANMDSSGDYFEYEAQIVKPLGMNLPAGANATGCSVGAIDPKGNVAAWNAEHTGVQSPFALKVGDTLAAVKDGAEWVDVRALPYQRIIDLIRNSKGKSVGLRLRRYDDMETLGVRVLKLADGSTPIIGSGGGFNNDGPGAAASHPKPIHMVNTKGSGELGEVPGRPAPRPPVGGHKPSSRSSADGSGEGQSPPSDPSKPMFSFGRKDKDKDREVGEGSMGSSPPRSAPPRVPKPAGAPVGSGPLRGSPSSGSLASQKSVGEPGETSSSSVSPSSTGAGLLGGLFGRKKASSAKPGIPEPELPRSGSRGSLREEGEDAGRPKVPPRRTPGQRSASGRESESAGSAGGGAPAIPARSSMTPSSLPQKQPQQLPPQLPKQQPQQQQQQQKQQSKQQEPELDAEGGYYDANGYYWDAHGYCWDPSGSYCWDAEGNCYDAQGNWVEDPSAAQGAGGEGEGEGEYAQPEEQKQPERRPPPRGSGNNSASSAPALQTKKSAAPSLPAKGEPKLPPKKSSGGGGGGGGAGGESSAASGSIKARMAALQASGNGIEGGGAEMRRPPPRRR